MSNIFHNIYTAYLCLLCSRVFFIVSTPYPSAELFAIHIDYTNSNLLTSNLYSFMKCVDHNQFLTPLAPT